MVLVLAKCEKISNTQAAGSAVTFVLKKLSQLSGKVMTAIMRQLLLWAEADEVNWMISDYWRGHFMDFPEKW